MKITKRNYRNAALAIIRAYNAGEIGFAEHLRRIVALGDPWKI